MIFPPEDVKARLKDQPFTPARLVTTTGQTYDVYHPDLVFVGLNFLTVGLPSAKNLTVADRVTRLALMHLCEIRDLPTLVAPSNGTPPAA